MPATEEADYDQMMSHVGKSHAGQAYWNALPTPARRGTAVVADTPDMPLHWARTEGIVGQRIAVVEVVLDGVNSGGGRLYLDDREGQGWWKVTERFGSPSAGHKGVRIVPESFTSAGPALARRTETA
ncbi:MAG: hypothetical protein PSX37_01885 [bacterium]|nr:hypothetical protein [bacterium]